MLVITGDILLMMKTSAPRLKTFSATYPLMPLTNVTTAMTAATPITTPSSVKAERSLFAQSDCKAIRMASRKFIGWPVLRCSRERVRFKSSKGDHNEGQPRRQFHTPATADLEGCHRYCVWSCILRTC